MNGTTAIAEVRLVHPELVLTPTIRAVPEMGIELEHQFIAGPDTYHLFFSVTGDRFEVFDDALAEDHTIVDADVVIDAHDGRVYRMELTSTDRLVLSEAAALGLRVLVARAGDGGWIAKLEFSDIDRLQRFRAYCDDRDVSFSIRRMYRSDDERGGEYGLTPVQRETLAAAYDVGYFNEPRDASLQELADRLDVSSSAVSGRLRRGIRALIAHTIRVG